MASLARKKDAITLMAFVGIISLVLAFGTLIPPPPAAEAGSYEAWLYLDCINKQVEEGDDFRLQVRKKYHSDWPHKTMRVYWYTDAITADETDYEYMYAVRQSSNGHQSENGKMGRDFHTLEDIVSWVSDPIPFRGRFRVRQTDRTLVIVGRGKAMVAALVPIGARTVAGADQARILQGRASITGR